MTNASIGAIHTNLPRTKRKQPTACLNDAPTIESSSLTDQILTPAALPCSPTKQHINVNSPPDISPLKDSDSSSCSSCSSYSSDDTIVHQREEGQQKLRELVINGASTGTIDWKSIISLAEDLHRKEQRLLNSYKFHHSKPIACGSNDYTTIGRRRNISRKQAFFELRSKRRENARRKKLESVGSFSVNLLLYGADECTNYCGESNRDEPLEEDPNQVDIYEDEESGSVSSLPKSVSDQHDQHASNGIESTSHTVEPSIIEGSFLAATSMYSSEFDEEDSSQSSNSESSDSTLSFSGFEMEKIQSSWDEDDGLITIHEDASVSLW